jgi:hypothetical protein
MAGWLKLVLTAAAARKARAGGGCQRNTPVWPSEWRPG